MSGRAAELPQYLGFGWLDPSSIEETNAGLTSRYVDERSRLAYVVTLDGTSAELAEHWNGQRLRRSRGRTLQQAAMQHAIAESKPPLSPRWLELDRRASELAYRHVFDDTTGEIGMAFFPAMHLMRLWVPRAPDLPDLQLHLPDASSGIAGRQNTSAMPPEHEPGATVYRWSDNSVTVEQVSVHVWTLPILLLERALLSLYSSGFKLERKERRPIVAPAHYQLIPATLYVGDRSRGMISFAIVRQLPGASLAELIEKAVRAMQRWDPPTS